MHDHNYLVNHISQIADLLRGDYPTRQYGDVILPLTVLRRLDCVLAPSKRDVLAAHAERKAERLSNDALDHILNRAAGQRFHNHSPFDFGRLRRSPNDIKTNLISYIDSFSTNVRQIFEYFNFDSEIERMDRANILYIVVSRFSEINLDPTTVSNDQMGLIFETLVRRFIEHAHEHAGDHSTPRDVIRLMVNLLFSHDHALLSTSRTVRALFDPACGTGGMLTEALSYLRERHSPAPLHVFGQELNSQTFAIAASGMLMKQADDHASDDGVRYGDTFLNDQFSGKTFDYLISHPPFGLNWKKQKKDIQREHETDGFAGRFGAGLPRISDASLLFLQHMIDKFKPASPDEHSRGSRLAIVFSGSPMFAGAAGSGESQIRKWIIENDWLEAVIALPEHIFYNTDIGTYVWIVTNRKEHHRRGCIQLIDARKQYVALRRSLSPRRRKIGEMEDGRDQITEIVRLYRDFAEEKNSRRLKNASFGYTHVTIERPLRLRYQMTTRDKARFLDAYPELLDDVQTIDATIGREPVRDWNNVWNAVLDVLHNRKTTWTVDQQKLFRSVFTERDANAEPVANTRRADDYEADPELRTVENVPLTTDVDTYFEQEVLPHVPDAWMDRTKDKIGYEINFNRYFYRRAPSRALADINADLKKVEEDIVRLLREVTE